MSRCWAHLVPSWGAGSEVHVSSRFLTKMSSSQRLLTRRERVELVLADWVASSGERREEGGGSSSLFLLCIQRAMWPVFSSFCCRIHSKLSLKALLISTMYTPENNYTKVCRW